MSTQQLPASLIDPDAPRPIEGRAAACWAWLETRLVQMGERLNPILIKEARQSLKSRQFTGTFLLVLIASWLVSVFGLLLFDVNPQQAVGPRMFFIFYIILAFPLLIIVPYGAFRSLAAEIEDRTFELLSISTLSARQVIVGKLNSAVLQMLIYLSAVMPCLAFTYLLRGLDILSIVMIVTYTVAASVALSLISLLLATAASQRYRQVILTVAVVLGLFFAFYGACGLCYMLIEYERLPVDEPEFWVFNLALLTAYVGYFVMFLLTAAAQLNFASSNRSTALRYTMVGQFVAFAGWMGFTWFLESSEGQVLIAFLLVSLIHWAVMGMFMTGEPAELSPRVMRDLPKSFLGRAFLTWYNPGPGTGYMLAISSFAAGVLLVLLAIAAEPLLAGQPQRLPMVVSPSGVAVAMTSSASRLNAQEVDQILRFSALGLSYLAIYLGIGKLLLGWVRRIAPIGEFMRVLLHVLLALLGAAVPMFIQISINGYRGLNYSVLHATNAFWTLGELFDRPTPPTDIDLVVLLMAALALVVLLANLPSVLAEVRRVRMAAPQRVAEDDAAVAAQRSPVQPQPTSPWD